MPRRILALLAALLFLAACSSSDADDAAPSAPSTSTTEASTTTTGPAPSTTTPATAAPAPAVPPVPDGPAAAARQIADAETAIRAGATGAEADRLGWTAQVAYRAAAARPEWLPAVVAAVPAELRPVVEANVFATSQLARLTKPRPSCCPDWRIVAPAPADELLGHYKAAEAEFGVPWYYLAAIHLVETRMGRIRGASSAGAQGPMQFMPATWAAYGEGDINSNRDSIRAAARYLKRNGAPADMRNAVWNYNHSDLYVDAVLAYGNVMKADERAFHGYHGWQVYYRTVTGDVHMAEGYGS